MLTAYHFSLSNYNFYNYICSCVSILIFWNRYITLRNDLGDQLDDKFTVFGNIVEDESNVVAALNATHVDDNNRPYQDIRILKTHVLEDPFPDSIHLSLIQKVEKTKYLGCPPITETIHARDPMGTFRPKEESQRIEREQNTDLAAKIAKGSVSILSRHFYSSSLFFKPVSLSLSRISFLF